MEATDMQALPGRVVLSHVSVSARGATILKPDCHIANAIARFPTCLHGSTHMWDAHRRPRPRTRPRPVKMSCAVDAIFHDVTNDSKAPRRSFRDRGTLDVPRANG